MAVSVNLAYAQKNGYFLNITNSNPNVNTAINNSPVVENVTSTTGTLNLQINADNISSVTISGISQLSQDLSTCLTSVIINFYL
ncbi:MAG: hypothetical protein ACLQO7_03035 [Candidatus Bathyarchaeia archaeon]